MQRKKNEPPKLLKYNTIGIANKPIEKIFSLTTDCLVTFNRSSNKPGFYVITWDTKNHIKLGQVFIKQFRLHGDDSRISSVKLSDTKIAIGNVTDEFQIVDLSDLKKPQIVDLRAHEKERKIDLSIDTKYNSDNSVSPISADAPVFSTLNLWEGKYRLRNKRDYSIEYKEEDINAGLVKYYRYSSENKKFRLRYAFNLPDASLPPLENKSQPLRYNDKEKKVELYETYRDQKKSYYGVRFFYHGQWKTPRTFQFVTSKDGKYAIEIAEKDKGELEHVSGLVLYFFILNQFKTFKEVEINLKCNMHHGLLEGSLSQATFLYDDRHFVLSCVRFIFQIWNVTTAKLVRTIDNYSWLDPYTPFPYMGEQVFIRSLFMGDDFRLYGVKRSLDISGDSKDIKKITRDEVEEDGSQWDIYHPREIVQIPNEEFPEVKVTPQDNLNKIKELVNPHLLPPLTNIVSAFIGYQQHSLFRTAEEKEEETSLSQQLSSCNIQ